MKPWAAFSPFAWFSHSEPRTKKRTPRLGLCLSSGGARGLAHVGVIQVLEEAGIQVSAIAGSSMGAYVGALWAAGIKGDELEKLAAEIKDRRTLMALLDPAFPPSAGLIHGDGIRRHLERSLGTLTFADLKIPLIALATDLDDHRPIVLKTGPVAAAIHASAAIPGVCVPVMHEGHRCTDGGASAPLPVAFLREHFQVDRVLAVNVMPTSQELAAQPRKSPPPVWNPLRWFNLMAYGNVLDTFRRALTTAQIQLIEKECAAADLVLQAAPAGASWYDFEHYERYIQAGREAATRALPYLRTLLEPQPLTPEGAPHHETHPSHTALGRHAA